ncbi:alpha/beta fold hydrolase [Oceanobacillus luteolus]|uniref:alpha/beta fold hydrolase n=1 Tax=Oceanobacillus luteolus TaxID=1274358 RepID=UPI003D8182B6
MLEELVVCIWYGMKEKNYKEHFLWDSTSKKLGLISNPTLIICGKNDVQYPVMYSVEMDKGIPNSKLVIFEKSNHYPFLEEAERFPEEYNLF